MGKKAKVKYCNKCRKKTVHKFVAKEHVIEDCCILRAFWAVGSLGLSEALCKTEYYKCEECGNIIEISPL